MTHARTLAALERELAGKYELSSTIRHRGERGRQREFGLADFLRENLTLAYGVATGELFTFQNDEVSPQCDIIVYDALRTHILGRSAAVQQVPIDGSYAVIEVKSILDATALSDANIKFAKIRSIWTSAHPDSADEDLCPLFMLFGFKSRTTHQAFLELLEAQGNEGLQIFALDAGCSIWVGDEGSPGRAAWLDMPNADMAYSLGEYGALAFFFMSVLLGCQEERPCIDCLKVLTRS